MKRKPILYVLSGLALASMLASCGTNSPLSSTSSADGLQEAYESYKANGGTQTYEEWLSSIKQAAGSDVSSLLTGSGAPSNELGKDGDTYINLDTFEYYVKTKGSWAKTGQIKETEKHTVNFYVGTDLEKSIEVTHGSKIEEPSIEDFPGYTITSWHTKENGGTTWAYNDCVVTSDLNLYASYTPNSYTVTLEEEDFGLGDKIYLIDYKADYDFTGAYAKDGYSYSLLDSEGNSYPLKGKWGVAKDMTLSVNWIGLAHTLTLVSSDLAKGEASVAEGKPRYNEKITVTATPTSGNAFYGWYNGEELLSYESSYTFSMPNEDLTLKARFISESDYEKIVKFAMRPTLSEDKMSVTYGLYPQTHVSDSTIINALKKAEYMQSKQSWWVEYNGDYYVKMTAAPASDATDYVYSDNSPITKGSEDWFKVEPIKWNIKESKDGVYTLFSDLLLDYQQYATVETANDYHSSFLRNYLTSSFYYSAFSYDSSFLRETQVDVAPMDNNSCEGSSAGHAACVDKVFPLSMVDYRFGLESGAIKGIISDYARALGAKRESSTSYCGAYWTSSPTRDTTNQAFCINTDENKKSMVVTSYNCIRPAIQVKIPTL